MKPAPLRFCVVAGVLWFALGCAETPQEKPAEPPPVPEQVEAPAPKASSEHDRPGAIPVSVEAPQLPEPPALPDQVPATMASCVPCHRTVVAEYLQHGMWGSVGEVGQVPPGKVTNPRNGTVYEIGEEDGTPYLTATFEDGGQRRQRLVGRIGAGIFDTSWVGEEVDMLTGEGTGRLFFAPVETITDHGHELSPFELAEDSAGLDLGLTEGCLTCHMVDNLGALPNAALARSVSEPRTAHVYPNNALGEDAFEHLTGLTCETCHGDTRRHLAAMASEDDLLLDEVGLPRLAELEAGAQRDVCARCHLQGDARIDLVEAKVDPNQPLAGQIPVLVPTQPDHDFRFVGQLERLALSPCYQGTPEMTCTTCHDPHSSVRRQGTERFEAICATCHETCSRSPELEVASVTGEAARTQAGCVDCHMRRSQPFDLPHVRSADHFIRRKIEKPEDHIPHRQFADREGELKIFDDGRLAERLASEDGQRWQAGVEAMGLLTLGRVEEAARRMTRFPTPGTVASRSGSAPEGLEDLETRTTFHQTRALLLLSQGQFPEAMAAFGDALAMDPLNAGALLGRARLRFDLGDVAGALADTQTVIDAYPQAEQPWVMRAEFAERLGRIDLALTAFLSANTHWPSDATRWYKQGLILRQNGDPRATEAFERARLLQPSVSLPGAGPLANQ